MASMPLHAKIISVLLATAFAWSSLLVGTYIFGDDRVRIFTHTSVDQGVQGRFLNDVFYGLFTSGLFTDLSPLSRSICLLSILLCGYLLIKYFDIKRHCESFYAFLPLLLVIFPLNSALIMYRYDSPGFGISLLLAVCAFGCASSKRFSLNILAALLLFMSIWVYQIFINAFLTLACVFAAVRLMENANFGEVVAGLARCAVIAVASCVLYLPVSWHAGMASMQPFADLPSYPGSIRFETIFGHDFFYLLFCNIANYLASFEKYFFSNYLGWFLAGVAIFAFVSLVLRAVSPVRKICALLMLGAAFFASVAVNLLLKVPSFLPRTCSVLAVYLFALLLFAISCPFWKKIPKIAGISVIAAIAWFAMSAATLSMIGNAYDAQGRFEDSVILEPLYLDFANLVQKHGKVYFTAVGTMPINHTWRVVSEHFPFVEGPTISTFLAFSLVSYFPAEYLLAPASWPDKTKYPVITKRLYYEIREVSPNQYFIIFDASPAPRDLKKFQTPYKLKY